MTLHRFATQSWFLLALLFLLAGPGLTGSAAAQEGREVVGKVIIATAGSVARGPDGEERRLRRRSKLFTGDTVVTSAEGRVQIRFSDGSLLGLKPKSEFRIEEYHYAGEADGSENAVYKLLKGGMRTITGAIGKTRKENYKVETEAATIGIRGTHYLLQVCGSGCGSQQAKGVFGGVVNGAISVSNDSGESTFGRDQYFQVPSADAAPKQLLRPPEFLADTAPIEESGEGDEQDESDAEDSGDADGESEGGDGGDEGDTDGDAGGETDADGGDDTGTDGETGGTTTSEETSTDDGGDEFSLESDTELSGDDTLSDGDTTLATTDSDTTETTVDTTTEYQSTEEVTSSGDTTATSGSATSRTQLPAGGALGVTFIENDGTDGFEGEGGLLYTGEQVTAYVETVDGAENIPVALEIWFQPDPDYPDDVGCQPCVFQMDSSNGQLLDVGGDPTLGVNWGRWEGNFSLEENGVLLQTSGSAHFIYSPNVTPLSTVQDLTGSFTYAGVGGTPPTDESGNVGSLGTAYLDVNFDTQMLEGAGLYVTFPDDRTYSLGMEANQGPLPLSELYSQNPPTDVHLLGSCTGTGCGVNSAGGHMGATFVGPAAEGAIGMYGFREGDPVDGTVSDHGVTGTVFFQQSPPAM